MLQVLGVGEGGYKYICDVTHGREQLFYVADDPIERYEMAGDLPEKAKKMRQRLAAWVAGTSN